ncbi:MAG: hypothetical protein A3B91_01400 [Candidatus Yanofskybacteria bacterium RIFCSPHIGHO2_02_FULL_41_29]|uniref:TrpR like protein, YerC/YecD n=1 Tax=Candidatus Yanofskybacteria bacterium RIFCSPHIGHO2_01_FULL_41_53 TaxID=1802663 RepID=A0A1F8EKG0_9BACT|nr:MAG: hypothetical protein A2650_04685 [Candidatus Yanofskybacteria bacterium RIFCSPHIGHO2_01_FULL_41_53]OGN12432.1 MAG: hypothetical protein A3B91_01400 [Candidatus Yanofskybacteria bacterium RIFCSPHIGHO2_02_FULL_41_29]OGN18678.1 MAG: hypothetical protein A3F48_02530 [Candidatus Yanofskybacteria bacterium RIFCSPHIGHO2_12_FULL_41_9]OGN24411.1 MAG: hypothetical protein A2916_04215 [Candidatus Yanofskybacteria bacterium RIFCSPLOWO2_01_FULL_41_67]OGN28644.1 MAG: hypothetical protein A3H54_01050 
MKFVNIKVKSNIRSKCLDALYAALDLAKERNEIKSFINDILTEGEKIMVGRRILIAKRLLIGQPYRKIVAEMEVGLDTVYRVKKWLGGRHKGYEKVVEKIKKAVRSSVKRKSGFKDYYPTGGFAEIRRRYKSYYWFSDLLDELNKDKK